MGRDSLCSSDHSFTVLLLRFIGSSSSSVAIVVVVIAVVSQNPDLILVSNIIVS